MLLAEETTEDHVVKILSKEELGGKRVREELKKSGIDISYQAVYKILKKLRKQEVILKNKTKYSINYVWLKRLQLFSSKDKSGSAFIFQNLREGDKITYQFKDLNRAGSFWMHVFQVFFDQKDIKVAIAYSPNEWTFVVREEQDVEWASTVRKHPEKITLFALGEKNKHNQEYKQKNNKENLKINVGKTYGFKKGYYFNVFNDYVVEMILPESVDEKISRILESNPRQKDLERLFMDKGILNTKSKLVIKRKKKLADKLYKKITQDFYLPKDLRK
jgi:DNA-binding PadR family transcriptional regulator